MALDRRFLIAAGYGLATEVPHYIRMYPAGDPETCFGPSRLSELYREVGAMLYAYGQQCGSADAPMLAEAIRIVVAGGLFDEEFEVQARFVRDDGRIDFLFKDESIVVLSSLAHESKKQQDELILRPGVTFPGEEIGPYLVGPPLGSGGTSVVHEVKDRSGECFAAKCLSPGRFPLADLADRFEREIEHLRAVRHANIIEYVDHCARGGADLILVLELAGETLASRLASERPSLSTAVTWLEEALSGVAHLHRVGIVHRDLAPRNFIFGQNGVLKLTDFGTSKGSSDVDLTADLSDVRLGSLIYISEEQRREPRTAGPADDVFSLGQIGYLLLTGISPQGNPPPLATFSEIPPELQATIEKMRSYRRSERFVDAGEALMALRATAAGSSGTFATGR